MTAAKAIPAVFSGFQAIRIINLPHRADRRSEMRRQLAQVGLLDDPRVDFFPAVACDGPGMFGSRGAQGCFLSHIALLQEAAATKTSILILEDDCDFLSTIADYAPPPGYDIFYGGWLEASDPSDLPASDLIGSHFMGFSARGAQVAVDYFADYVRPDFVGDPRAIAEPGYDPAIRPPIDGGYVWLRRAHPELATVFAMLSAQRPSRSDIGAQRIFDRLPLVRDVAQVARRVRRTLSRG
jgi:glycosyl transferase, family 25